MDIYKEFNIEKEERGEVDKIYYQLLVHNFKIKIIMMSVSLN